MKNNLDQIIRNIFQADTLDKVSIDDLNELIQQFPSFNFAHFMISKKMCSEQISGFEKESEKTALYFTNPFWLQCLLHQEDGDDATASDQLNRYLPQKSIRDRVPESDAATNPKQDSISPPVREIGSKASELKAFEPYYTIDYFASQGIKVTQDDDTKSKFDQQLKSFTEWLRTMKKLPNAREEQMADSIPNPLIERFAAHSLEQREVITETMAEVLIKQGKNERAAELYRKLSLLNPSKNTYFAAKIDEAIK